MTTRSNDSTVIKRFLRRTGTQFDVVPEVVVEPIDDVESTKVCGVVPIANFPQHGAGSAANIQPAQGALGSSVFDCRAMDLGAGVAEGRQLRPPH